MAKPGREFEEAVYSFAKTLDPTAKILFDHRAIDRDTGKPRQCDVWINAKFGGHWPLSILVSCKDHHRKLHVGDIGAFYDEVRSTGASTGVIYSRAGFTKPALDKAKANGLACCRIYQNEPADIPQIIRFDQFTCKPAGQLELETNLMATKYKTWNDLFDIIIRCDKDDQTALDVIAAIFEQGEEWSLQQLRKSSTEEKSFFPPNWSSNLEFEDIDSRKKIQIKVMGRWKRYKTQIEAILLNGSYCLTDGSFKGDIIGPSIDTQGEHPGGAWTEIIDTDYALPLNRVLIILSKGDIRSALREKLGPTPLH
jgi:Restriction endonuclease